MREEIHALSMTTLTPAEWASAREQQRVDKLVIEGGAPLAGEIARLRREERRAADPLRGAAHAPSRSR